jgi:hypothetical protein
VFTTDEAERVVSVERIADSGEGDNGDAEVDGEADGGEAEAGEG